jgi:hypothetical protein
LAEILRPMSTGELMDRALVLYKKNFKLFVGIASLGPATSLIFQLLTITSASVRAGTPTQINPFSAASLSVGFTAGLLIMMAGMAIAHAATVRAVAAVHLGFPIKIWEAYKALKGRLWRVIGVFVCMLLLAALAVLVAILFVMAVILMLRFLMIGYSRRYAQLFALVFGFGTILTIGISALVVWVRYALAIACCVVEDLGVVKSIKRSAALSKGSRFRIFLIYGVFVILAIISGAALAGLAGSAGFLIPNPTMLLVLQYLGSFMAGVLTGPLAIIGIALVYYDERVRKEAFDLQIMMSSLDTPSSDFPAPAPVQP